MLKSLMSIGIGMALIINLSGCAVLLGGAVGGASTAFWLSGKLRDEVNASYERTIVAAKKALESLDMKIDKETTKDDVTQLRSNYVDGSEVWVDIRPLTETSTKVEIRVGVRGDEAASGKILGQIKKYL